MNIEHIALYVKPKISSPNISVQNQITDTAISRQDSALIFCPATENNQIEITV